MASAIAALWWSELEPALSGWLLPAGEGVKGRGWPHRTQQEELRMLNNKPAER